MFSLLKTNLTICISNELRKETSDKKTNELGSDDPYRFIYI